MTRKPPITPRQAVFISLGCFAACTVAVVLALTVFQVPPWEALTGYAILAFFVLAFPWASLDWQTRNRSVRAHNFFVYFVVAMVIVTLIMQWGTEKKPFPPGAIAAVVVAGVAAYSVMAYYAIMNIRRWLQGDFRNPEKS